jgi:hypothetical protein
MAKKTSKHTESIAPMTVDELAVIIRNLFTELHARIGHLEQHLEERLDTIETKLDHIEFISAGQGRRIELLEDRVRRSGVKNDLDRKKL